MIYTGLFALATAALGVPVADGKIVPRGEVIAGALVRVPARATDALTHPLVDDGRVRGAIAACVAQAERSAPGRSADALAITSVERVGAEYRIAGRVAVNRLGRDWRSGDRVYGRGWGGDFRDWKPALRGFDALKFSCRETGQGLPLVAFD